MSPGKISPDHCSRLYGRKKDMDYLLGRISSKGITALAGRPKMGKTWLLEELARQHSGSGYLVGYNECRGEHDQVLRTLSNLYSSWLAEAKNSDQAKIILEQNRGQWVGKVGKAIASLLSMALPENVGATVRDVFQELATIDANLKNGALNLTTLPYDQALELLTLLSRLTSGKSMILIFDAWEKSSSIKSDKNILEGYLNHIMDWPQCHIFLGIRYPEFGKPDSDDNGWSSAKELEKLSAMAHCYVLGPMDLSDSDERKQMIHNIKEIVPAASVVSENKLLEMIDGFPGVLDRWFSPSHKLKMQDWHDLECVANNALELRYPEFHYLFSSLTIEQRKLAIRAAVLPRLNSELWGFLREIILDGIAPDAIHELNILNVFEGRDYPFYGHDTRHTAAWKWFASQNAYKSTSRFEVEAMIFALCGKINGPGMENFPYVLAIHQMALILADLGLVEMMTLSLSAMILLGMGVKKEGGKIFYAIYREAAITDAENLILGHPETAHLIASSIAYDYVQNLTDGNYESAADTINRHANLLKIEECSAIQNLSLAYFDFVIFGIERRERPLSKSGVHLLADTLKKVFLINEELPAFRQRYAKYLQICILDNSNLQEEREQFLNEMRHVAMANVGDRDTMAIFVATVAESINMGLADEKINELEDLTERFPDETSFQCALGMAFFYLISGAKAQGNITLAFKYLALLRAHLSRHAQNLFLTRIMCRSIGELLDGASGQALEDLKNEAEALLAFMDGKNLDINYGPWGFR